MLSLVLYHSIIFYGICHEIIPVWWTWHWQWWASQRAFASAAVTWLSGAPISCTNRRLEQRCTSNMRKPPDGAKTDPKRIQKLKTVCVWICASGIAQLVEHLKPQGSCKSRARSAQIRSVRCAVPQNAGFVVSSWLIGHPPNLSIECTCIQATRSASATRATRCPVKQEQVKGCTCL